MQIDQKQAIEWLLDGEVGLSSKNIVRYLTSQKSDGSYPHDPADLRRCVQVLHEIGGLYHAFNTRMEWEGPVWKALVRNWPLLTSTLAYEMAKPNATEAPKTYALMQELIAQARKAA
jgi:hypothetical protein